MHTMTVFVAADESRWDSEEACAQREADILACARVTSILGPVPESPKGEGCAFENGAYFVQRKPKDIVRYRDAVIALLRGTEKKPGPLARWFGEQEMKNPKIDWHTIHPSWFARMLDGASGPHDRLVSRLSCFDAQGREWGQPYYASNPNEKAKAMKPPARGDAP